MIVLGMIELVFIAIKLMSFFGVLFQQFFAYHSPFEWMVGCKKKEWENQCIK